MVATNRKYGICDPDQVKDLTGLQFMQGIANGDLPQATMARTLGFWLDEAGDGYAVFKAETGPEIQNPLGTVHGGWVLTIIDSAAGCAAHTTLGAGVLYTTVETKVNMTRPILENTGLVVARGEVISRGRRIITAEAKITAVSTGKLLAHGTSTLMVL